MQDITEQHLAEIDAAWAEQNLALMAATQAFDAAVRAAQDIAAAKLTESRERAWGAIQERLRVWQGFGPGAAEEERAKRSESDLSDSDSNSEASLSPQLPPTGHLQVNGATAATEEENPNE